MPPKEKAEELVNKFWYITGMIMAKEFATICVNEIELALTEYGRQSDELQNMDGEWRYWDAVKNEVLKK